MKKLSKEEALELPQKLDTRWTTPGIVTRSYWDDFIERIYADGYYICKEKKMKPREYYICLKTGKITRSEEGEPDRALVTRGKKYAEKASRFAKKGDFRKACEEANLGLRKHRINKESK